VKQCRVGECGVRSAGEKQRQGKGKAKEGKSKSKSKSKSRVEKQSARMARGVGCGEQRAGRAHTAGEWAERRAKVEAGAQVKLLEIRDEG